MLQWGNLGELEGGPNEKRSQELARKLPNFQVSQRVLRNNSFSFLLHWLCSLSPTESIYEKTGQRTWEKSVPEKLVFPSAAWSVRTGRLQPFPGHCLPACLPGIPCTWLSMAGKVGVVSPATHPTTKVISGNILPKETWLNSHGKDMSRPVGHLSPQGHLLLLLPLYYGQGVANRLRSLSPHTSLGSQPSWRLPGLAFLAHGL